MTAPGYCAERSIYRSRVNYPTAPSARWLTGRRSCSPWGAGSSRDWSAERGLRAQLLVCADACVVTGGAACYGCIVTSLAVLGFGGCADCIPTKFLPDGSGSGGGGGGGGSVRQCCERDPVTVWCRLYKPPGGQCP